MTEAQSQAPAQASEAPAEQGAQILQQINADEAAKAPLEHARFQNGTNKVQGMLNQRVEKIRSDRSLNDAERTEQIREAWNELSTLHRQLRQVYGRELEKDVQAAEEGLFGVDPFARTSVRQAYESVHYATAPAFDSGDAEGITFGREELERYSERARRTGDKALETAVFHIAVERGHAPLRDKHLAQSAERRKNWTRLVEAERLKADWEDANANFDRTISGHGMLAMPEEIY